MGGGGGMRKSEFWVTLSDIWKVPKKVRFFWTREWHCENHSHFEKKSDVWRTRLSVLLSDILKSLKFEILQKNRINFLSKFEWLWKCHSRSQKVEKNVMCTKNSKLFEWLLKMTSKTWVTFKMSLKCFLFFCPCWIRISKPRKSSWKFWLFLDLWVTLSDIFG